jgi:hypothetical protein
MALREKPSLAVTACVAKVLAGERQGTRTHFELDDRVGLKDLPCASSTQLEIEHHVFTEIEPLRVAETAFKPRPAHRKRATRSQECGWLDLSCVRKRRRSQR